MTVNDKVSPLNNEEKIEDAKFVDPKKQSLKDKVKSYIDEHPKQAKIVGAVAVTTVLTALATIGILKSKKHDTENQIIDSTDFEVIEIDHDPDVDEEEIIVLEEGELEE